MSERWMLSQYKVNCACGAIKGIAKTKRIANMYNLRNIHCQYCGNSINDKWFYWCENLSYFHANVQGIKQFGFVCFACIKKRKC